MKQWNFKMKKLYSKTLKTLINELNRPVHECKWETFQKKAICILIYYNIEEAEISHVFTIKSHCQWEDVLSREHEIVTKDFLERFGTYIKKMLIKRWIFYDSDETEIRFHFNRSFSILWNILDGLCTQIFHSSAWSKRWLEVICVVKSKATTQL